MLTDFEKKKKTFDSFRPFSEDFKVIYGNLNHLDLAHMNLKLDGSNLTREGVNELIRGGVISNIPLMEHLEAGYYGETLRTFSHMVEMDMELDTKQLIRLYKVIRGNDYTGFRSSGTTLFHLGYTPPHFTEVEIALNGIFTKIFGTDFGNDPFRKAVAIHNGIIEVYPFKDKSEALARTAMEYELVRSGLPVVPFELTESQYNSMLSEYLHTGEWAPLYDNLVNSAMSKLDLLMGYLREEGTNR